MDNTSTEDISFDDDGWDRNPKEDAVPVEQESPTFNSPKEKRKFINFNGEIGYMKGSIFVAVTNFSVECIGYVTRDENATTAEGYLIDVIPKDSVPSSENEDNETQTPAKKRESYYLTWKDMSTQMGILNVISSTKLWTAPSKDQYLPGYFKSICDEYAASADAHRMYPVKGLGLQKASERTIWVIGSNFQVELRDGKARRLETSDSPYCVIGCAETSLPCYDFEGSLDDGETLKRLIDVQYECMGENFLPSLFVLGGLCLAVHFEQLFNQFDGVPLIVAYGAPVSGKSTAVEAAMAVIGQSEKIGECTLAGVIDIISRQSLPFWWDDADKFPILEQLAVMAFNKSIKKTSKSKSGCCPRTVPLITMNPTTLTKNLRNNKEKMLRTFSRVVVIPFSRIKKAKHSLVNSLNLQTRMKEIVPVLLKSIGVILEIGDDFLHMREDPLFQEVIDTIDEVKDLDMRTQCNYAVLLYSTAKITQKIGLKEELMPKIKEWMLRQALPHHINLIGAHENAASVVENITQDEHVTMRNLVVNIVKKVSANPKEGKEFFNPRLLARKCHCGQVFGFNVGKALAFAGLPGADNAFRSYVREQAIGCNGVKVQCGKKQWVGTHIKVKAIPEKLLVALYKAFGIPYEPSLKCPSEVGVDQAEASGYISPKVLPNSSNIPNEEPFAIGADAISEAFHQDLTAYDNEAFGIPYEPSSKCPSEVGVDQAEASGYISPKVLPNSSNIPNEEPFAIGADAISEAFHQDLTAYDNEAFGIPYEPSSKCPSEVVVDQAEVPGPVSPKVLPIPSNIPNKEPFAIGADDAIPEGFHQDLTASTTDVSDIEVLNETVKKRRRNLASKLQDDLSKYFAPVTERSAKNRKISKQQ